MSEIWLYRVRGPWVADDWMTVSDLVAQEQESRNKCDVTIIAFDQFDVAEKQ